MLALITKKLIARETKKQTQRPKQDPSSNKTMLPTPIHVEMSEALEDSDCESISSDINADGGTRTVRNGKRKSKKQLTPAQEQVLRGLGQRETKAVACLRLVMLGALCLTAVALCSLVYYYTRTDEVQEFEEAATLHGAKIIDAFHTGLERRLGAIHKLSTMLTTQARQQEVAGQPGFPFVTLPDWEIHSADTRVQAEAVYLMYAPLVREGPERLDWEAYALQARFHLLSAFGSEAIQTALEDRRYNQTQGSSSMNSDFDPSTLQSENPFALPDGFIPQIYDFAQGPLPYTNDTDDWSSPAWQPSPPLPVLTILNGDLTSPAVKAMVYSRMATVGPSNVPDESFNNVFATIIKVSQYRYQEKSYANDPISNFLYPVFDTFDPMQRQVKGQLTANIYWRLFFRNVLPEDAVGIIVVLKNTFNQTFSYRIDGRDVSYMGDGDFHDEAFDHLEQTARMGKYLRNLADPTTRSYTSVSLDDTYSDYILSVYPSQDTEDTFLSNKPIWYTSIVLAVFLLSCTVFVLYDYLVQRRQALVVDKALKSGTLLSTLFPANVRDRLMDEATTEREVSGKGVSFEASTSPLSTSIIPDKPVSPHKGLPIAEKYEKSTILFADIAGFTKWSSTREPTAVFQLLETLYGAFDKIAERRKVYKIETIGDCYVAVTGVPEEQEDHAARAIKFARAILLKMRSLKISLAETLGADTEKLELRIGIHTGSVTAGVLRGQRSRFQLFGDTVNTASRMESNGVPGRIHVSQAVATELQEQGYSRWLLPRADKVIAKGKGEMQTYWIVGSSGSSSGMPSSDGDEFEGSTTRHYGGSNNFEDSTNNALAASSDDLLVADRDFEETEEEDNREDDEILLSIEESLQRRTSMRKRV